MLYLSDLVHRTIVHSIVCRRFKAPSIDNPPLYDLTNFTLLTKFFLSTIFPNIDPMKHGINKKINS